jgi:hypothetical protein
MFSEGLCDGNNELFAFVKAWEFLVTWATISFRTMTLLLTLRLWVFKKIYFGFFTGSFVVYVCVIQHDFLSSQVNSTLGQIRTIEIKIMLLTGKTHLTKWGFRHRTLLFSRVIFWVVLLCMVFNSRRFGTLCLFHLHRWVDISTRLWIDGEKPKDYTRHSVHGESLK